MTEQKNVVIFYYYYHWQTNNVQYTVSLSYEQQYCNNTDLEHLTEVEHNTKCKFSM